MTTRHQPDERRFSDDEVREILELALRQPPASSGLTLAELREIAEEIDLDEASLRRAVEVVMERGEREGAAVADDATSEGHREEVNVRRSMAYTALGAALGLFTTFVEGGGLDGVLGRQTIPGSGAFIDVPVTLLLVILSLVLARRHWSPRRPWSFALEAGALWAGFAAGWTMGHGSVTGDLLGLVGTALLSIGALAWLRGFRKRVSGGSAGLPVEPVIDEPGAQRPDGRVDASGPVLSMIAKPAG